MGTKSDTGQQRTEASPKKTSKTTVKVVTSSGTSLPLQLIAVAVAVAVPVPVPVILKICHR